MDVNIFGDAWRTIIATVDRAILNLVAALYDIMQQLASTQVFSEKAISDFASRIYTLLALVMVFKVTFSLITYLVDPDTIADKESGAGNVAKNIIIVLILIIAVPYCFDFLYRAQSALLKDNFVAKLVYGKDDGPGINNIKMSPKCSQSAEVGSTGQYLAMATLRPFYQISARPNEGDSDVADVLEDYCSAETIDDLIVPEIYKKGTGAILGFQTGTYVIDYSTLISTICAIVVMILMLSTCLDIALRVVKLGFLELVAPIPIISYVDPKSGKNGIFKKWTDAVIATWASLFIKLIVIYFAIYTIALIADAFDNVTKENNIWIILFLIIGALMFAKQAPKLIEDIFGIQLDGKMFHPIKKIKEDAVGGKLITSLPGKVATGLGAGGMAVAGSLYRRNALANKIKGSGELSDVLSNKINNNYQEALSNLRKRQFSEQMKDQSKWLNGQMSEDELHARSAKRKQQEDHLNKARQEALRNIPKTVANMKASDAIKMSNSKEANTFSSQHPIVATALDATIAAKNVVHPESGAIGKAISDAHAAATNAAKDRAYKDTYSIKDRWGDFISDVGNTKYSGGTANQIESDLKALRDEENRIRQSLDTINRSISNLPAGSVKYDQNYNLVANPDLRDLANDVRSGLSNMGAGMPSYEVVNGMFQDSARLEEALKANLSAQKEKEVILQQKSNRGNKKG